MLKRSPVVASAVLDPPCNREIFPAAIAPPKFARAQARGRGADLRCRRQWSEVADGEHAIPGSFCRDGRRRLPLALSAIVAATPAAAADPAPASKSPPNNFTADEQTPESLAKPTRPSWPDERTRTEVHDEVRGGDGDHSALDTVVPGVPAGRQDAGHGVQGNDADRHQGGCAFSRRRRSARQNDRRRACTMSCSTPTSPAID